MERQGGQEADDPARHRGGRERQRMMLRDGNLREPVEAASDALQHTLPRQPGEHLAVDAQPCGFPRRERPVSVGEFDGPISLACRHV